MAMSAATTIAKMTRITRRRVFVTRPKKLSSVLCSSAAGVAVDCRRCHTSSKEMVTAAALCSVPAVS